MIYCVRVKPGVQFTTIAPGGFVLLGALDLTAKQIEHDLTITSACDGLHSGPDDPHHRGEAYDVRTHDLPNPEHAVETLIVQLGPLFFAFLEDAGTDNEHIHCQVRKGTVYPPLVATAPTIQT
jgi:hypothetical protein